MEGGSDNKQFLQSETEGSSTDLIKGLGEAHNTARVRSTGAKPKSSCQRNEIGRWTRHTAGKYGKKF